jgi:hypothetical protein
MRGSSFVPAGLVVLALASCAETSAETEPDAPDGCDGCSTVVESGFDSGFDSGVHARDVVLRPRVDVDLSQFWDVPAQDTVITLWDAGPPPPPPPPPPGACDPAMIVDLGREATRVGTSLRWTGRLDQSALESPLVPGPNCPPSLMFHRVLRYRVERPGDVAIWALRGAFHQPHEMVIGVIDRCGEGGMIVSCDQSVPDARVGQELLLVVGLPVWSTAQQLPQALYTVALTDGLPPPRPDGRCASRGHRIAGCPVGAVCELPVGLCSRLGAPGGLCNGARESPCEGGECRFGRCRAGVPELGACLGQRCLDGLDCVDGYCRRRGSRDAPCREADAPAGRCDAPWVCEREVCRRVAPPDHPCDPDACAPDTRCTVTAAGSVCVPEGIEGGACRGQGAATPCDPGLTCTSQGRCERRLPTGAPCASDRCAEGGCVDGRCTQGRPPGAACDGSLACAPSATCVAGVCRPVRRLGEACDAASDHCLQGACTRGRCAVTDRWRCDNAGTVCAASEHTCNAGYCRSPQLRAYCADTSFACPAGAACTANGYCATVPGAWCGRAEDPPCPSGAACEHGRCVTAFACQAKQYHLCSDRGAHCLGGHRDLRCVVDGAEGAFCRLSGRPCDAGLRCSGYFRCERAPVWPNYSVSDGECVAGVCPEGRTCDSGRCIPTQGEGGPCFSDATCTEPLRCLRTDARGVCTRPGGRGAPCRLNSPTACDEGLSCSRDRCLPPTSTDGSCVPGLTVCPEGLSCAERANGAHRCVPDGTERGTDCRTRGRACDEPLHCTDQQCRGPVPEGMVCRQGTWFEPCAVGLACQGNLGECRAPGRAGGICAASESPCPPGFGCFATRNFDYTPTVCLPVVGEGQVSPEGRCAAGLFAVASPDGRRCLRAGAAGAPCRFTQRAPGCDPGLSCDIATWICQ